MGNTSNKAQYWSKPNPYVARIQDEASTLANQYNRSTTTTTPHTPTQHYSSSGASGYRESINSTGNTNTSSSHQFTAPGTGYRLSEYVTQSTPPSAPTLQSAQSHNLQPSAPILQQQSSTYQRNTDNASKMKKITEKLQRNNRYRTDHKAKMRARWIKYKEINQSAQHNNNIIHTDNINNLHEQSALSTVSYNPFLDDSINTELDITLNKSEYWSIDTIELLIRILNNLHNSINTYNQRRQSRPDHAITLHGTTSANSSEQSDKRRIKLNNNKIQTHIVSVDGAIELLLIIGFTEHHMPSNTNFGTIEPYLYFDLNQSNDMNETIDNIVYCIDVLNNELHSKHMTQQQYEQKFDPF